MGKYIDWYLVEIERRLRNRLPDNQVYGIELEVEDHLSGLATEFEAQGVDPNRADRMAVESFGFPERFLQKTLESRLESSVSQLARQVVKIAVVSLPLLFFTYMGFNGQDHFFHIRSDSLVYAAGIRFRFAL